MTAPTEHPAAPRPEARTVLISGAGVAGPALALRLARHGLRPTVVEIAPAPRPGGQAVDFRGETQLHVLRRMGILDELQRLRTGGSPMTFVDAEGRQLLHLPAEFAGGDIEVLRGDLSRVLHEASLAAGAEYVFGDCLTSLTETATGVDVTFRHAPPRSFDLVIGADGLHSHVRSLAFGPDADHVTHLGHYAATWSLSNHLDLDLRPGAGSLGHNAPGRLAAVAADHTDPTRARAFLVFASPELAYDRHDPEAHKRLLRRAFAGLPWKVDRLLDSLETADDLYFDSISRADAPAWSTGRIALLGDAACGATIGGMGTGTAILGAYVLAGELSRSPGDHRGAFTRYESLLRAYAQERQKGGDRTGRFLAPASKLGLRLRNTLLGRRRVLAWMLRAAKEGTALALPHYPDHSDHSNHPVKPAEPVVQRADAPVNSTSAQLS
ncbi:2-polyprenyl-6-methoxyphenol hydroxylase-like FAD-dependent oxidoreductase [Streptomyces sp. CG 926]|uniref:FAD-dependent monooxygenase n=1 Tax=Streptomyces sp. CG 926 TaxID=1882405 RepID=UPI000D6BBDFB|nr:FAD-dependent monooxygenase [Streptomyces sp. CG 926]PWK63348.1 2-polyprenyl-6-methoxyphenol hydroxylase-like FAD-dependent oxidoreductase [Streptomyces sp. CG 926]